jgi:Dyp-type peroxidase family
MDTDVVGKLLAIEEPVLPVADIQGIVVPGFMKPHETLLGVQFGPGHQVTKNVKQFIRKMSNEIATADQSLKDRRDHREVRRATKMRYPEDAPQSIFVAVAFSYGGLTRLTPGATAIPSDAFRQGMAVRSAMLGDPESGEGSPGKWEVGGPGKEVDALFIVAGDSRTAVSARADDLKKALEGVGADVIYREDGDIRDDLKGHEHFGFDDGVSQPGIRGRASVAADAFITERHIAAARTPESSLFGYPGQDLIWPGVLLLGHPSTSPDPLVPGIPTPTIPEWTRNGSFLVFRRLVQDVGLFWRTLRDLAGDLAQQSGFENTTDDTLAARLVGRWPSGAPVNRVPAADDPNLGKCTEANNHFRFDSDAAKLPLRSNFDDMFPMSRADPAGVTCPWAAHIRKVNTRDSSSDVGGREATYARRILRVGIPFGPPLPMERRYADQNEDKDYRKRGLLFQCVQASIEDQFEFLTTRWMNDPARPKMPGGHDLLIGQNNAIGEDRRRRCVVFGLTLQQAEIGTSAQWVIPTGGGYFFVPSISALREVLGN